MKLRLHYYQRDLMLCMTHILDGTLTPCCDINSKPCDKPQFGGTRTAVCICMHTNETVCELASFLAYSNNPPGYEAGPLCALGTDFAQGKSHMSSTLNEDISLSPHIFGNVSKPNQAKDTPWLQQH